MKFGFVTGILLFALGASTARAGLTTVTFASNYSRHHLAQFDGVAAYDSDTGKLNIAIHNTTTAAHGGFLTGIALSASGPTLSLEAASSGFADARNHKGLVKAGAFGQFYAGATTGQTWAAGKQAAHGIAAGSSRVLTFDAVEADAGSFTVADFLKPGKAGEEISASFRKLEHHHADRSGAVQSGPVGELFASQFDPVSEQGLLPLESGVLAAGPIAGTSATAIPLPPAVWMGAITIGLASMVRSSMRRIHI